MSEITLVLISYVPVLVRPVAPMWPEGLIKDYEFHIGNEISSVGRL